MAIVMKKLHLALGVENLEATVADYSQRFGQPPTLVIPATYALWRTETLNISVRQVAAPQGGPLRHLGWEDDQAAEFSQDTDCNGIVWEHFTAAQQAAEIAALWPDGSDGH